MAELLIKNVPPQLAKKFAHATDVSYDDFVTELDDMTDSFSIKFNPPIQASKLLEELKSYDG